MAVIDAETDVLESTLNKAVEDGIDNEYKILSLATAATAAGAEYILEKDGFSAPMIVDLLTKRFHNYVQLYPKRGAAAELHNHDFMDMIYRGIGCRPDAVGNISNCHCRRKPGNNGSWGKCWFWNRCPG
jgi:hypothetical protein